MGQGNKAGLSVCSMLTRLQRCYLHSVPITSNPPAGADSTEQGSYRQKISGRPHMEDPWPPPSAVATPSTQNFLRDK